MKVKFGMFITDGVNKVGGNVVSRNHYGRFARRYVVPVDPASALQLAQRANFGTWSTNWKFLSGADQAAWLAATVDYPRTDSIGNIYYPTAQALYIELNTNLGKIGEAPLTTPPVKVDGNVSPDLTVYCSVSGVTLPISYSYMLTNTLDTYIVRFTAPLNAGVNFPTTQYRFLQLLTFSGQGLDDFWAAYIAKFGIPVVGKKIFAQFYSTNRTTGSQSLRITGSCIVQA